MTAISAIPTKYAGVQFRSRLEARWAAFFDIAGWRWEYEPLDLDGYIPDFVLAFARPLLVEVKPIMWEPNRFDEAGAVCTIIKSGWKREALVVGAALKLVGKLHFLSLGTLFDAKEGTNCIVGDAWPTRCQHCERRSVLDLGGHGCRAPGCMFRFDAAKVAEPRWDIVGSWREAGNRVQWRAT